MRKLSRNLNTDGKMLNVNVANDQTICAIMCAIRAVPFISFPSSSYY